MKHPPQFLSFIFVYFYFQIWSLPLGRRQLLALTSNSCFNRERRVQLAGLRFSSLGPPSPLEPLSKANYAPGVKSPARGSRLRRHAADVHMSDLTLNVEKQFSLCGLSLQVATCLCTAVQFIAAAVLGVMYKLLLDGSVMISILLAIHLFCSFMAFVFLIFCLLKRKFGTFYEVLLHAYLLSILVMGLASLFVFLFLPLAFLQQSHSLGESLHYAFLWVLSAAVLCFQFIQKNLVEQMLPVMEHNYR